MKVHISAQVPTWSNKRHGITWGQLRRPASIWPVWLESSSIACLPRIIKSGFCSSAIAFRSFATPRGWSLLSSATSTWIALSAPIAKAVLKVSWAFADPHETAMISVEGNLSLMRTASSTAISSKGFMLCLTLRSTSVFAGFTRTLTAEGRCWQGCMRKKQG